MAVALAGFKSLGLSQTPVNLLKWQIFWFNKDSYNLQDKIMRPNFDSLNFVVLLGVFAIAYIPISAIAIMVLLAKGCG
jgi:hypothetical protein